MYEDYKATFSFCSEDFDEEEGIHVDANRNPCKSEGEFMQELKESKCVEHDVFGLIQGNDWHIQFETFSENLGNVS